MIHISTDHEGCFCAGLNTGTQFPGHPLDQFRSASTGHKSRKIAAFVLPNPSGSWIAEDWVSLFLRSLPPAQRKLSLGSIAASKTHTIRVTSE
jgi:hypothetical protein